jgi:hypothetical protein
MSRNRTSAEMQILPFASPASIGNRPNVRECGDLHFNEDIIYAKR